MFTVIISHHPAMGKAPELSSMLQERSKAVNAAGTPHLVGVQMYGAETVFITVMRHENLGALEAYNHRNAGDPSFAAFGRAVTALLDRQQSQALFENVVPAEPKGDVGYIRSITYTPTVAGLPALREALEVALPAAGAAPGSSGAGIMRQVAPEAGPSFTLNLLHADLAGMEEFGRHIVGTKEYADFRAKLASCTDRPQLERLVRVLSPFGG